MAVPPVEIGLGIGATQVEDLRRSAAIADDTALSFISVGDNPGLLLETYASLTVLASVTKRVGLGTTMTSPIARHPLVVASAASTIAEVAGGDRLFLGIATGRWSTHVATLGDLRDHVVALKELWSRGETRYRGDHLRLSWPARPVRILIGAAAPKALRLAGEVGDGVIVESGVTPDAMERACAAIDEGARASGRSIEDIELWWYLKAAIADNYDEALVQALSPLAASGALVLGRNVEAHGVPERFRAACVALNRAYDLSSHVRTDSGDRNRGLLDDPALRDYILDRFGLVGKPEDWVARITELRGRGIDRIFCAAVVPDPGALMTSVDRDVLAVLAR